MIVLNEASIDTSIAKLLLLPGFEEEATLIAKHPWFDQHHFGNTRRNELHID
jgi:hypothetical protein